MRHKVSLFIPLFLTDFPESEKLTLFIANMWREVFLSQSAISEAMQLVARQRARGEVLNCLRAFLSWEKVHLVFDIFSAALGLLLFRFFSIFKGWYSLISVCVSCPCLCSQCACGHEDITGLLSPPGVLALGAVPSPAEPSHHELVVGHSLHSRALKT